MRAIYRMWEFAPELNELRAYFQQGGELDEIRLASPRGWP